jgi:hypothetical protein
MHEVDNETWPRSIVATLGLGIVGASREDRGNTPMVPLQHSPRTLVGLRRSFARSRRTPRALTHCSAPGATWRSEWQTLALSLSRTSGRLRWIALLPSDKTPHNPWSMVYATGGERP